MNKIRRRDHRIRVNFDFKYSFNNKQSKCSIVDISERGMLLKIPQILDIGDIINLIFEDNSIGEVTIEARVIHKNNNYIGVNFIEDEYEDLTFIRHFINSIKDKNKLY